MTELARALAEPPGAVRLAPVGSRASENQRWLDHDLASLVEGMLGVALDPLAIEADERARWAPRLPRGWRLPALDLEERLGRRCWIEAGGERVGTIAWVPPRAGATLLDVFSVYVRPDARRRGLGAAALDEAERAARAAGLRGIRLETEWTWHLPARWYLRLGFWVRDWRRAISLERGPRPHHRVEVGEERASFGDDTPWLRAERQGAELRWEELPALDATHARAAVATFSLALALAGWPLVRSDDDWQRARLEPDVGGPASLARRIEIFEAVGRRARRISRAPRIPGLPYRDLDEIE